MQQPGNSRVGARQSGINRIGARQPGINRVGARQPGINRVGAQPKSELDSTRVTEIYGMCFPFLVK